MPKSVRQSISFDEFLMNTPPGEWQKVELLAKVTTRPGQKESSTPEITLYCNSPRCGSERQFRAADSMWLRADTEEWEYVHYHCRNCSFSIKTYALRIRLDENGFDGRVFKIGEYPDFGIQVPREVQKLLGDDWHLFLKGRSAENRGLGIGAFAYYRRVVEHTKNRLLDEIVKIVQHTNADPDIVAVLEAAKGERQFSKAVKNVKEAIPDLL